METALFRIAQEAMINVLKHAGATQIIISLDEKLGVIQLSITDNGRGFVLERQVRKPDSGWGLIHMRERVEAQSGELRILSSPGEGTRIVAAIPR
jgi:signal transduction histidine kinase